MCTWRRLAAISLLVFAPAPVVRAQIPISGEATATIGSRDDVAFFNYTDYEHNARRMFRVSLAGMWRPASRLALLAELRSEDVRDVIPYAMYVRVRPFAGRALFVQAGRIAPVFGAFGRRTYGSDANPLIGYPLAYQYLTSLRADAIPAPRYFAAARADRTTFSRIRGERLFEGAPTPWDAPVTRLEVGGGLYLRRTLTARAVVQRNWRDAGRVTARTFLSGQLAHWF